jgi:hypothetical protein
MKYEELASNKKASPIIHLIDMDLDINLMQATMGEGTTLKEYTLVKSENNDRTRGTSLKSNSLFFN